MKAEVSSRKDFLPKKIPKFYSSYKHDSWYYVFLLLNSEISFHSPTPLSYSHCRKRKHDSFRTLELDDNLVSRQSQAYNISCIISL